MTNNNNTNTSIFTEFAPNVYTLFYPIRYAGCKFNSRMTVIRLSITGDLLIHSPCEIDDKMKSEIEKLGTNVAYIVAPGNYHHLHVPSCQKAFPNAKTYICPGVEEKCTNLKYDEVLEDHKPPSNTYENDLDQIVLKGNRIINEVVYYHKSTKTLILVDSIENIGDTTPDTNWLLRFYWKYVMFMWNKPKPAPEYQMGWKNKLDAKKCMEDILKWDFQKVILAHGDNIETNAQETVQKAWSGILLGT